FLAGALRGAGRPAVGVGRRGFGHREGAPGQVHGRARPPGVRVRGERRIPLADAPGSSGCPWSHPVSPAVMVVSRRPAAVAPPEETPARHRGAAVPAVVSGPGRGRGARRSGTRTRPWN